jgi:hypothetical protein
LENQRLLLEINSRMKPDTLALTKSQVGIPYDHVLGDLAWPADRGDILACLEDYFADCYYHDWPDASLDIVRSPDFAMLIDWKAGPDDTGSVRTAGVFGASGIATKPRDKERMAGLYGPTEKTFGKGYDKGHYISRAIGGDDNFENANLFPQLRHINRGTSDLGKLYRNIERHCASTVGTLFFSRPIYENLSWRPKALEVGTWRDGEFEVCVFPNVDEESGVPIM